MLHSHTRVNLMTPVDLTERAQQVNLQVRRRKEKNDHHSTCELIWVEGNSREAAQLAMRGWSWQRSVHCRRNIKIYNSMKYALNARINFNSSNFQS